MGAFDTIRSEANKLYSDVVADGVDLCRPLEFVTKAAERVGYSVAWLSPDDPALKGSHGVSDEQTRAICCAKIGGEAELAALVAHEIGHAVVHAGSTYCAPEEMDPSRSTEAAPVGLQRVEDYGARERRELQANVFARELLLPRSEARRLYLSEHMTALSIAAQRCLHKDLVRQQLLDALLLPNVAKLENKAGNDAIRPDPSQDDAAAHRGSAFQLQAGPGTGKTRTLVKRVLSLLSENVDPASILILTFSNRAAGELADRIALAAPVAAPKIWIGTFHAFGLDLARRFHEKLGLGPDPALFDRSDAVEVLEDILPTLPLVHYRNLWDPALVLRDIVSAISRAKDEMTDPVRYRELATGMRSTAVAEGDDEQLKRADKALEVAQVYELYQKALTERAAVDFGDLVMRPALLLRDDLDVQNAVRLRHRHVLVDEYQDVNHASACLLRGLAGDGERLWVVGDARQSIYRFRGASSSNMTAFFGQYAGAKAQQLGVSYRSTQEVIDAFLTFSSHMGSSSGMLPLHLTANRGRSGIEPELLRIETPDNEIDAIAGSVRELEERGVPLCEQAVLCRGNDRLGNVASGLAERGIPVLHLGSLFERDEIRDLLALLHLAIDTYADGLTRVGAMPRYGMTLQDIRETTKLARESDGPAMTKFGAIAAGSTISPAGARALELLADDLSDLRTNMSPWEFLARYLLDRPDLFAGIATSDVLVEQVKGVAIWQFLNFVRDRSPAIAGLPIQRLLDRVRQLVLFAEERDLRQIPPGVSHLDAVRLMTVHGSKGLEFEAVHIPGMTVSGFPTNPQGARCPAPDGMVVGAEGITSQEEERLAHTHEEECLFFVAASRAKTHLRLYSARKQANGSTRNPSPFLDLFPARDNGPPTLLGLPAGAPQPIPVPITFPAEWRVTDTLLGAYRKCPRRFFYTHVLGLGGGRKPTPFSRTHDCLYKLIEWLNLERAKGIAPEEETATAKFDRIWQEWGPTTHAFAADYRLLSQRLVSALIRSGEGRQFRPPQSLAIDFPNGRVFVEPNEIADLPDGTVVLRRVRTGKKRSDEYEKADRLEYGLYIIAANTHFGGKGRVQALHLTDGSMDPVTMKSQMMTNRRKSSDEALSNISAGWFPPKVDNVSCPRCPHFFICAAMPAGRLQL